MTTPDRNPEGLAWRRLHELAPRGRYEHVGSWDKRNRHRASFLARVDRTPGGCWEWTGQQSKRGGKHYPAVSHRVQPGNRNIQRSAFVWMVEEFFPEMAAKLPHRTAPNCGSATCINLLHRVNMAVTNNVLTPEQACAVYAARGGNPVEVGAQYGIGYNQVMSIWRGRNWSDVTGAPVLKSGRKVVTPELTAKVLERKGTASSRVVGAELDVSYKTVLRIWNNSNRAGLLQEQGA